MTAPPGQAGRPDPAGGTTAPGAEPAAARGYLLDNARAAAAGPAGYVLATDIDPSWLTAGGGYEVRRHDVADTALQPLACLDDSGPAQQRANRLRDAVRELLTRRGADLRFGRTLPRALRDADLADVAAGELDLTLAPLISAWGRRPAGSQPARAG